MAKQATTQFLQREYDPSQSQTAAYIGELLQELEQIASRERIEPLDKLLKIAREEAARVSASA